MSPDTRHLSLIMILNFLFTTLVAYLLGSIPSGVIVSRFFARRDVRTVGSGHTGALNTYRAAGFTPALFAFVADGAKAIVAIYFARYVTQSDWGFALAGIAVVIGHCYPIYTRFHGGMGLATSGVVLFSLDALMLVLIVLIWFALKYVVKKSARASAIVALLLPILLFLTGSSAPYIAFGIGAGAIIFVRHLGDWNR
jgi:glycerol-3-phosphate acyltransferase PlsY